jgi:hypothetical protein
VKFQINIRATSSQVEANAHLNQTAHNWDEAYSYFNIIAKDLGATNVPPQPRIPATLVAASTDYEITLKTTK